MKSTVRGILMLMLFAAIQTAASSENLNEEDGFRCKKELPESYNLNGYLTPRTFTMYVCPNIKSSCCSLYDQFLMFTNWRDKIKPKLVKYYDAVAAKFMTVKTLIKAVFELDFEKMIDRLHVDDKIKETHLATYLRLKQINAQKMLEDLIVMQKDNAAYMLSVRASFYCVICDFESHKSFDLTKKTFGADFQTCTSIAMNTINFSYFFTINFARYMQALSKLMAVFALSEADKPIKIRFYKRVSRQVRLCGKQVIARTGKYDKCKKYCEHWKLNANSPVQEGYQVFLNDAVNALNKFLKNHGKSERILAGVEALAKVNFELPLEQTKEILQRAQMSPTLDQGVHTKERKLNGENEWFFDPMQAIHAKDPYDEGLVDPNFDEYVLNHMFNLQEAYERDRQRDYAMLIKNKLFYTDVEHDNEKADENDLFKINTGVIVDLENFRTVVSGKGFNVVQHIEMNNINASMRDLVTHLKTKSRYKILYEKIDPAMLMQVNGITNDDVANFHRDHFLMFRDFSPELKKNEMEAKFENKS